jgi:hypothetical protein
LSGFNDVTLNIPELGAPVPRRFHKSILTLGRFVDPETGEVTNFDRAALEELAKATNRWIAVGYKVWFPPRAERRVAHDAGKNMGYWTNFVVEGDELAADVDVPDEAIGKKIGLTILNVCPGIRRGARSATGERFPVVIDYVAASTNAVMAGLGGFVGLSLSLTRERREPWPEDNYPVIALSRRVKLTREEEDARDLRAAEALSGFECEIDENGLIRRKGV